MGDATYSKQINRPSKMGFLVQGLQGRAKRAPAKLSEENSVWADGRCIGSLGPLAAVRRGNSNMQEFFLQDLA